MKEKLYGIVDALNSSDADLKKNIIVPTWDLSALYANQF